MVDYRFALVLVNFFPTSMKAMLEPLLVVTIRTGRWAGAAAFLDTVARLASNSGATTGS